MLENQEGATVGPTMDELRSAIKGLEQQLEWARNSRDEMGKKLDDVRSYIQNSIDNGDWADEDLDEIFWEELAEKLDLEMKKTIEIEITARWTATAKIPRSMSFDSVAENISIEEPEVSRFGSIELDDVYEREFDVTEA
jgi:hypothetical protein